MPTFVGPCRSRSAGLSRLAVVQKCGIAQSHLSCARDARTNKKSGSQGNERSPFQGRRCARAHRQADRRRRAVVFLRGGDRPAAPRRRDRSSSSRREPLRLPPPAEDEVRPRRPEPKPALPVSPTLKVQVTQFTFSGNTLFTDEELPRWCREFVGKELDFEGLNDAATKVRAYHRSRGYFLAQAYLPQQAIRDGSVEIAMIEGRVGHVELQRRPASAPRRVAARRHPRRAPQARRHHHRDRPGEAAAAASTTCRPRRSPPRSVRARPSARPTCASTSTRASGLFNGYIDFDNHGSRFTGEYRIGANLNVNNPLTIGDQLTLRAFTTDEDMYFGRARLPGAGGILGHARRRERHQVRLQARRGLRRPAGQRRRPGEERLRLPPDLPHAQHQRDRPVRLRGQAAARPHRQRSARSRIASSTRSRSACVGDFRDGVLGGGLNAFSLDLHAGRPEDRADVAGAGRTPSATGLNTARHLPQVELRLQAPEPRSPTTPACCSRSPASRRPRTWPRRRRCRSAARTACAPIRWARRPATAAT